MRKLHLILCIALFSVMSVQAQEKGDVELGFVWGVNISNLSGLDKFYIINNSFSLEKSQKHYIRSIRGNDFGLSVDYYFLNQLSLRINLLYDNKGAKFEEKAFFPSFYEDITLKVNSTSIHQLNYFSIPVVMNWHLGFSEGKKNFNLNFGPYIAFLLGGLKYDFDYYYKFKDYNGRSVKLNEEYKEDFEGRIEQYSEMNRKWFKERYNGFDFGIAFGLGYKFNLSDNVRLFIEYAGQAGLADIYKDKDEYRKDIKVAGNVFDINIKNFRHAFNVGLVFNLMKKKGGESSNFPVPK